MPTYVYKFVDTGETVEIQQSFTDPTLTQAEHPVTGAVMAVKKVFQPVGVTFRGDGFYKTDSRSGSAKSSTSSSDAASSSSSSDSSAGTASTTGSSTTSSSTTSSSTTSTAAAPATSGASSAG